MAENNSEYIQLLAQKLLLGTITDDERIILEDWYSQTPDQKPEWQLHDESKDLLQTRLYTGIKQNITPVKPMFPTWAKVAAAALVMVTSALGYLIYSSQYKKPAIEQFSVASTEGLIRKILLPDHSIVWLKGNSNLEYPSRFSDSTRNVILHGEALFEISKDRTHPFIIKSGNYLTRVVGTSFNIKENQQAQSFKLTVLTGKVSVTSLKHDLGVTGDKRAVLVTPGLQFESSGQTNTPLIKPTEPLIKIAVTKGTEYDMSFDNLHFAEIKSRVEKKFDVEIIVNESAYANCELSANVTDQSLDNTLKVICAAMGATYTILNNKITITGGGCN